MIEEEPFGLIKKTIINHDIEKEDLEFNNRKKLFLNRETNIQTIKRKPNENFKIKITNTMAEEEAMDVEISKSPEEVNSPIQGYRVLVSNLHPNVTEDDILELFSAIGPIKRAKLNKGTANVVFVKLEDARNAISSYNSKLLDGRELKIELLTKLPISEKLTATKHTPIQQQQQPVNNYQFIKNQPQQPLFMKQQQITTSPPVVATALPQRIRPVTNIQNNEQIKQVTNPVSLSNRFTNMNSASVNPPVITSFTQSKSMITSPTSSANSKVTVDTSVIHQALFTTGQSPKTNQNPVTFTVKI
jgi:RNA recognition motif-containing protein